MKFRKRFSILLRAAFNISARQANQACQEKVVLAGKNDPMLGHVIG